MSWLTEYSCFLHPREVGSSLEELCQRCGEPFGFPLLQPPLDIAGQPVLEAHNRGFYGALFVTENERTRRKYAVKVIPQATYLPSNEGGWGDNNSFFVDAEIHSQRLADLPVVPRLEDYGEQVLTFGQHDIPCYWARMDYIEGPTLAEKLSAPPSDPREIAQIAWDLLDFLEALEQRGVHHNDLHPKNIKVIRLAAERARRQAIHPYVAIRVLDLGSASTHSKSNPSRLGDVHWVARHILELLNAYQRENHPIKPEDLRLCAQLRKVAELYCGVDRHRRPKATDMKTLIYDAHRYGIRPWPVHLDSIADHYNAQTLPPWFAPYLLCDPDGRWTRRLTGPGPVLMIGMRGCGKTILLRSLEWAARVRWGTSESTEEKIRRVRQDSFLALFVSCSSLLRGPRPKTVELIVHRLFLAFAREVIRNLHLCEIEKIGEINYGSLEPFLELVSRIIPWFDPPTDQLDLLAIEHRLSDAIQDIPPDASENGTYSPRDVFDALATATGSLVDLWSRKRMLFLLDDVSTRYLPSDDVRQLLSQFCLQSPDFAFKISTETQTIELITPSGDRARSGRDYDLFDLGEEVYLRLKGPHGTQFIQTVLALRSQFATGAPSADPGDVLGRQTLKSIAANIRSKPGKTPVYGGIETLAAICVGDIGDILQLYAFILERSNLRTAPVATDVQHRAITDYAEKKLLSLAGDPWLFRHAISFAQASYEELKDSDPARLRQYAEIFVRIGAHNAEEAFDDLIRLVDAGIFVFTGATIRTKTARAKPALHFKLAYRKLLGITNRMPISTRDRFELSGEHLLDWLREPTPAKLQKGARQERLGVDGLPNAEARDAKTSPGQMYLWAAELLPAARTAGELPQSHLLYDVYTVTNRLIVEADWAWEDKHLIAAFGFEDRSLGSWHNLGASNRPGAITMLRYPDPGFEGDITSLLASRSWAFEASRINHQGSFEEAEALIASINGDIALDVTSLTKTLIYSLVTNALISRGEVWVLHASAAKYYPFDSQLAPIVELFETGKFPEALEELDKVTAGEIEPFTCGPVGPQFVDPNQSTLMVTFVSLKNKRVIPLLAQAPVEAIAAIAPLHTDGPETFRSKAACWVANYLAEVYSGSVYQVDSLDHDAAYQTIKELHRRYALDGGYNFELALTGTKMHAVAAGMLASIAAPSSVYFSSPAGFNPEKFTKGTGVTRVLHLKRVARTDPY